MGWGRKEKEIRPRRKEVKKRLILVSASLLIFDPPS